MFVARKHWLVFPNTPLFDIPAWRNPLEVRDEADQHGPLITDSGTMHDGLGFHFNSVQLNSQEVSLGHLCSCTDVLWHMARYCNYQYASYAFSTYCIVTLLVGMLTDIRKNPDNLLNQNIRLIIRQYGCSFFSCTFSCSFSKILY